MSEQTDRRAIAFTPMETRRDLLVEAARLADSLGYEFFMLPEAWGFDSTIILAEISMATSRIRPTSCILSIWGRTPGTIAMSTASLHDLSEGRYVLGLGVSTPALAEGFHDVPYRSPAAALAHTTRQVRTLLAGERVDLQGESTERPLKLGRPPVPDVEIHLAAMGPRNVRVAAELADGWIPVFTTRETYAQRRAEIDQIRAEAGRADAPFAASLGPMLAVHDDPQVARADVASNLAWYLCSMGETYPALGRAQGFGPEVAMVQDANPSPRPGQCVVPHEADRLLDAFCVYGTEQDVADKLAGWQSDVDVVTIGMSPGAPWEVLEAQIRAGAPGSGQIEVPAHVTIESAA